jgi:hypothetical protein
MQKFPLHHLSLSAFPFPIIIMLLFRIFLILARVEVGDMEKLWLNQRADSLKPTNHHLSLHPSSKTVVN